MHILYVDQHFKTPEEGGAIRSYYLAKGLVDAGHRVTLVSAHSGAKYQKVFIDGIHVHYLPAPYHPRMSRLRRTRALLHFVWLVCRKASLFQEADLCYTTATPLTVGLIGLYFRRKFAMPFYAEVRELASDAPFPASKGLLTRLEKRIYPPANALVALSPAIAQHLRQVAPHQVIHLIPEVADCRFFSRSERSGYHERQFDVAGKFVVTYFGPLEPGHPLEHLMDAALACQQKQLNEVLFLIVDSGSDQKVLQDYEQRAYLDNVQFLPPQNKYGMLSVFNVTDVAYISFSNPSELSASSPTTFFDALAAGKLCITNARGWISDLVEENHCGFYASPHHPEEFVTQLAPFVNNRPRLDTYQANARALAEQRFEREKQVNALLNSLGVPRPVPQEARVDILPV